MKNKVLLLLFVILFIPFSIKAEEIISSEDSTISDENLILVEPELSDEIYKGENKSMFWAGDTETLSKTIQGIFFAAGNNVTLEGLSEYGMFAGNSITVSSNITKDLFVAANSVYFTNKSFIGRDAYIAANNVYITTIINGDLKIMANNVLLSDTTIYGDVDIDCSSLKIGSDVTITGTLSYNEDANYSATNIDNIDSIIIKEEKYFEEYEVSFEDNLLSWIFKIVSLLIVCYVINLVFPKFYKAIDTKITTNNIFKKMGIGLIMLVCIPVASIFVMLTGIGVPLGLIVLVMYVVILYLSIIPCIYVIGNLLLTKTFKKKDNVYISLIIGILVIELINLIPFIGGFIYFLFMLIGLGYFRNILFNKKD